MKFKSIFIIFNTVLIFSFLFIFLMPLFVLETGTYGMFLGQYWYLAVIFLAIIATLNSFFIYNWKIIVLLEREDWPQLHAHLTHLIFTKKKYSTQYIKYYINTSLLMSDIPGMEKLEQELQSKRPTLLAKNAVLFGVRLILTHNIEKSIEFFSTYLSRHDVLKPDWITFDLGFTYVTSKKYDAATEKLISCAKATKEPVLKALCAHLLNSIAASSKIDKNDKNESLEVINTIKTSITKKYSKAEWIHRIESAKSEVYIVIFSRLLDDTSSWLYK